jgi:hypothetical protein
LTGTFFVGTLSGMDTQPLKHGRPRKTLGQAKDEYLDIRLSVAEKQAFRDAADLAGLDLSAWVRERLRTAARKELDGADRPVAFLLRLPVGTQKQDGRDG